ncbi:MAG: amidohydrolase, partial [Raineya sp.]|nr:amidohydrolase [Raineya sp.]
RFYVDSLVHDPEAMRLILKVIGEDKIVLGTDYPFPLGELEPGKLVESMPDLSEATKEKILGLNALAWLNMSIDKFLDERKPDFQSNVLQP